MGGNRENILYHQFSVTKEKRHDLNGHKSCVLWFTGLSGAGKSTISMCVEKELYKRGIRSYVLDGDNIRLGLNNNLSFTPEDRKENIRRVGEVSKLFVDAGLIVLAAFISPYEKDRKVARELLNPGEFIEIYVKCSLEECERRDPKFLYKKARNGEIHNFTGISAPYEEPLRPELTLETDKTNEEECVELIINYLANRKLI
ncbi:MULTISPECIES: adenylyl-sulfate kinase [unclassified Paenibacillus]|uniref:adenylyl-sulfate kinase n=1 Tax=unclassified Paenibacillus TaxID=185978 RepID=UPI00046553EF|nr:MULTISPECIES: adenylyl-sulfate kinase [unclassified Paenibacillus]KGP77564.1 adenylylsulfate kinase [Paenibacillus sp. MAEPY2]KGP83732.1 adenylylsulfate kinase [Paenibacillus sp. MAEPY1]